LFLLVVPAALARAAHTPRGLVALRNRRQRPPQG
jgi:hypothetical protein